MWAASPITSCRSLSSTPTTELVCSRGDNPDLFELTLGAMGLTGHIATVTLQLQALPGVSVRRVVHPVRNLAEAVELMGSLAGPDAAGGTLYSWTDLNSTGGRFGRGVVYVESFENAAPSSRVSYRPLGPGRRRGPAVAGRRVVTRLVNAGYATRDRLQQDRLRSIEDAAFPINGNEVYYRLFGRRGFREYQVLVPTDAWPAAAREIERLVTAAGAAVTLGSLKLFRGDPRLLWFRGDGVCLAIDVAAGERANRLFTQLDRVALDHDALVNLSKDSRLDAGIVGRLYPGYEEFCQGLGEHDPKRRFDSMLRRRIGV
jgi:decaprenylphospho-beta-D-ribofuranose 2-oxidase